MLIILYLSFLSLNPNHLEECQIKIAFSKVKQKFNRREFPHMIKIKYLGLSMAIFGSLFKLMSWTGASVLLIIGLSLLGSYYLLKVFKKTEFKEDKSDVGRK
ncbi:hypothetical protein N9E92_05420 [Polaribacter sp.]|jgi:hypothetical protein|nr:hypothetical protein [Polaribacter sp.]